MGPWEPAILKSQPPPVHPLAVAPARPLLLACFPTDRPPALPAPRSWHSLRSLGFGLGLRCLVPSGNGYVSLALVVELPAVSAALPGLGNTRRAELRVI